MLDTLIAAGPRVALSSSHGLNSPPSTRSLYKSLDSGPVSAMVTDSQTTVRAAAPQPMIRSFPHRGPAISGAPEARFLPCFLASVPQSTGRCLKSRAETVHEEPKPRGSACRELRLAKVGSGAAPFYCLSEVESRPRAVGIVVPSLSTWLLRSTWRPSPAEVMSIFRALGSHFQATMKPMMANPIA
jgi:hypothetical protein